MSQTLTLLMAQFNPTVGAIVSNTNRIMDIINTHQQNHDVIVFPELAITGYPPEDLLFREELYQRVSQAIAMIQNMTKDCFVIIGHPLLENNERFNAASVFNQGSIVARYHKQKIPNYGVFDEMRYFTPGEKNACVFQVKGHALGLCICEDVWQPGPVEHLANSGIELLICINASPFDHTKTNKREALMQKHAKLGLSCLYVNQVGGQDDLVFDGQSFAMDPVGNVFARAPAFEEALETVVMTTNQHEGIITPRLDPHVLIYQALVCGLKNYVEKNGFPGVLLGLSGGIDSALTLAIAVDALGASRVQAVLMPSRYTASISIEDAHDQIKRLQVKHINLSIEPTFNTLLTTLTPAFEGLAPDITEENLQARIRGLLLMALSNKHGYLVLSTSNKSESAVGYGTLYGDMAGGFAVLKDVLKTQVYELAKYRNTRSHVIPERVLMRAPSAELAENQTDQDTLPDYAVLDAIIIDFLERDFSAEDIIHQGHDPNIVNRVIRLITRNEYKRRQSPPGIKISTRSFDREWRYPITSGFIK